MTRFQQLEAGTLKAMMMIYCQAQHGTEKASLCPECQNLLNYAKKRIDKCIYGDQKPVCSKCTIHCYKPEMRIEMKKIMQYSGPRMLFTHPFLAIRHLYRSKIKSPREESSKGSS